MIVLLSIGQIVKIRNFERKSEIGESEKRDFAMVLDNTPELSWFFKWIRKSGFIDNKAAWNRGWYRGGEPSKKWQYKERVSAVRRERDRKGTVMDILNSNKNLGTVCPRSIDPFYICTLLYKMGHYFLDIQYNMDFFIRFYR